MFTPYLENSQIFRTFSQILIWMHLHIFIFICDIHNIYGIFILISAPRQQHPFVAAGVFPSDSLIKSTEYNEFPFKIIISIVLNENLCLIRESFSIIK